MLYSPWALLLMSERKIKPSETRNSGSIKLRLLWKGKKDTEKAELRPEEIWSHATIPQGGNIWPLVIWRCRRRAVCSCYFFDTVLRAAVRVRVGQPPLPPSALFYRGWHQLFYYQAGLSGDKGQANTAGEEESSWSYHSPSCQGSHNQERLWRRGRGGRKAPLPGISFEFSSEVTLKFL